MDAPMTISPQIYQKNNKTELIKASCSMPNSNDNTMTLNEDSDNEVEIWNRDMDLLTT